MKQSKPKTFSHGVRLREDVWPKLRAVMRHKSRAWLETLIEREYRKLPAKDEA